MGCEGSRGVGRVVQLTLVAKDVAFDDVTQRWLSSNSRDVCCVLNVYSCDYCQIHIRVPFDKVSVLLLFYSTYNNLNFDSDFQR